MNTENFAWRPKCASEFWLECALSYSGAKDGRPSARGLEAPSQQTMKLHRTQAAPTSTRNPRSSETKSVWAKRVAFTAAAGTIVGLFAFGEGFERVSMAKSEPAFEAPVEAPRVAEVKPLEAEPAVVPVETVPSSLGISGTSVATYISRSYRVTREDALQMTEWAIEIGRAQDVDPLLILAVVGTESSYNAKAKSRAGAEGLMQVMTRVHLDKFEPFGGRAAALEPYPNMVVGTSILASLIKKTGSVTKALKWYSGAALHDTDFGYGAKVLKERNRLLVAAKGDSDGAVQLSRTKKSGPAFEKKAVVKHLPYEHWEAVEVAANKAAAKRSDATSEAASEAVLRVESGREAQLANVAPKTDAAPVRSAAGEKRAYPAEKKNADESRGS